MDGDFAITSALRKWKMTTLHLFCSWHIFKNVLKNCASSFPDGDELSRVLGLFRSAAYAATPEAFYKYRAELDKTCAGKGCERYMRDLIEDKSKWAFSCRQTFLTLGMAATQRTEGLFGVFKRAGIEKKLSMCALWQKLQHVNIYGGRVGHVGDTNHRFGGAFSGYLDKVFDPIKGEINRVGVSRWLEQECKHGSNTQTMEDTSEGMGA
eukprot:g16853.t1